MKVFKDGIVAISDSGRPDPVEVERARAWIQQFGRRLKNVNYRANSYMLKHCVERWWRATRPGQPYYVSNGAFIQAAMDMGYRAKPVGTNGDAVFNMSVPRKGTGQREQAGFVDLPAPRKFF